MSRNEQVITAAQTDVNNHHETPGEQPGVPVTNQFHTLDKVDKFTRAASTTAAETDDGAQTETDRRHERNLADDDGVNGITLLSVDGCNQSITATADMGADNTLSGVDGDADQAGGSTDGTNTNLARRARAETTVTDVNVPRLRSRMAPARLERPEDEAILPINTEEDRDAETFTSPSLLNSETDAVT